MIKIGYFISEAVRGIFTNLKSAFSSVIAMSVCIMLLGTTLLFCDVISNSIKEETKKNLYLAYVEESLTDEAAYALQNDLEMIPNVDTVSFVSKDVAKKNFANFLGSSVLNDLPSDIFRHRFSISFTDGTLAAATLKEISQLPGIAKVSGSTEVAQGFETLRTGLSIAAFGIVALLLITSFIIISNTISISVEHRIKDIHIMELCGVSRLHIRFPLILEGVIIGTLAAILSFIMLALVYNGMYTLLNAQSLTRMLGMPTFGHYMFQAAELTAAFGILVGAAAGIFSSVQHQKPTLILKEKGALEESTPPHTKEPKAKKPARTKKRIR